jgi:hypothetical protein
MKTVRLNITTKCGCQAYYNTIYVLLFDSSIQADWETMVEPGVQIVSILKHKFPISDFDYQTKPFI